MGDPLNEDQRRQPPADRPEFAEKFSGTYTPNKACKENQSKNDARRVESLHLVARIRGFADFP
jgi:hypothetical protein